MERKLEIVASLNDGRLKSDLQKMRGDITSIGKDLARALIVTGAGAAVAAGVIGTNYETALRRVSANANASAKEVALLNETARRLGGTTSYSAGEAADALYNLSSAGLSVVQATQTLPAVLNLAGAEAIELADAASYVTNTMGQFKLGAEQAERIANTLSATVSAGNLDMTDLGFAMKFAGTQAAGAGISLEETNAALATLSELGIKGETAGTSLRQALNLLVTDGSKVSAYMKGVNLESDGLANTLRKLEANGLSAAVAQRTLGIEGAGLYNLLRQGADTLDSYTQKVSDTDTATRKYAAMMDTVKGDFDNLKSAAEEAALQLFDTFKPELREAIQSASKYIGELAVYIQDNKDAIVEWIRDGWSLMSGAFEWIIDNGRLISAAIVGVGAALVTMKAAETAVAMWGMVRATGAAIIAMNGLKAATMAHPIGLLAVAVGAVTAAFILHESEVSDTEQAYDKARAAVDDYRLAVESLGTVGALEAEVKSLERQVEIRQAAMALYGSELAAIEERGETQDRTAQQLRDMAGLHGIHKMGAEDVGKAQLETLTTLQGQYNSEALAFGVAQQELALAKERLGVLAEQGRVIAENAVAEAGGGASAGAGGADTAAREKYEGILGWEMKRSEAEALFSAQRVALGVSEQEMLATIRMDARETYLAQEHQFVDAQVGLLQTGLSTALSNEANAAKVMHALKNQAMGSLVAMIGKRFKEMLLAQGAAKAAELAVEQVTETGKTTAAVQGAAARIAVTATETSVTAASTGIRLADMGAGVVAFYSRMGPLGIPLAAATIAAFLGIARNFAGGGPVSGPGGPTSDSIPAFLSNGEYVMPARQTAQNRGALDAMRSGGDAGGNFGGLASQIAGRVAAAIGDALPAAITGYLGSRSGERLLDDLMRRRDLLGARA